MLVYNIDYVVQRQQCFQKGKKMGNGNNLLNGETIILIFAGILIGLIFISLYLVCVIVPFAHDIAYIKMEYKRSRGSEKKKWKRRLIRAYLNLIPGLGNFLIR